MITKNLERCDKCGKSVEYLKYGRHKEKIIPMCQNCFDEYNKAMRRMSD
jgi:hypothetical protein